MAGMIAIDTECTGLDLRHAARPFFVTIAYDNNEQSYWEWPVDPHTRIPQIPPEDLLEIKHIVDQADVVIGHNIRFDITALQTVIPSWEWDWDKTHDTMAMDHLLHSGQLHRLESVSVRHCRWDITPYEMLLGKAVKECRRKANTKAFKAKYGVWKQAKGDQPDMPSVRAGDKDDKDKPWKNDMWLPAAMATTLKLEETHWYRSVLRDYSNTDSAVTMLAYKSCKRKIEQRQLTALYEDSRKQLQVLHEIENTGVTLIRQNWQELYEQYEEESQRCERICVNIAADMGFELVLPKSGNNKSLTTFAFEGLKLPVLRKTETGQPSLDKHAFDLYLATYRPGDVEYTFLSKLAQKRKRDTALGYLDAYERFQLPTAHEGYYRIHPSLKQHGTRTTRLSSSNPNEQNISKKGLDMPCPQCKGKGCDYCGDLGTVALNVRYVFGPAPGREWWSMDYQNLELRIPAYEVNEEAMVYLFEHPNDPPYYGSNHLFNAHVLFPKEFEACVNEKGELDGRIFKKRYENTLYRGVKAGDFAVQYGAQESSGTADRAFGVKGGQALIQHRLGKITALNRDQIAHAKKYGYIYTMPRKSVDPKYGYPLECTRTEYDKILDTVPLSYHVQGTAGEVAKGAMWRCSDQLREWKRARTRPFDGRIIMNVHDELVFDFPKSTIHPREDRAAGNDTHGKSNWWRACVMRQLMELSGNDIGVPTPVSVSYHPRNWGEEDKL